MPQARAALARFEGRLSASTLYDASLCLSELVTNAIQHPSAEAGDKLELELVLSEGMLRVQVVDPGSDFEPGPPTEGDERGWGLFIVDQLSTNWGMTPGEGRTTMWFEIGREENVSHEPLDRGSPVSDDRDDGNAQTANAVARPRLKPALL